MDARNNDFPLQSEYNYTSAQGSVAPSTGPAIGLSDILAILRREWRLPVFGSLIGLTLGLSYSLVIPTLYKSSARILLDRSVTRYLHTNRIADDPTYDEAEIASQLYILSSESIAVPVVRSMNLAHDREFVGSPKEGDGQIDKVKKLVKQLIGWSDHANAAIDPDAALEETAVESFLRRLTVYREDIASVINVTFASEDPNKAANIANTVADTYIATTLETKLRSTKMVSQWLQDRLTELKAQAIDADRALQNYKIANNLVNTGKGSLSSEQLSNLNTQLTNARVAVGEAKARLDGAQQMGGEGMMSRAATENLTKLRSEHRDVAAKASELEASVGPGHFAVVKHSQENGGLAQINQRRGTAHRRFLRQRVSNCQDARERACRYPGPISRGSRNKQSGTGQDARTRKFGRYATQSLQQLPAKIQGDKYPPDRDSPDPECAYPY